MENIMLDTTKQYIKIVDFGLSNIWCAGGALRTPCGSLEYAAPELFVDGRRYGPEVDLWSIGVIVYGMVTGGLPFTGADGGGGGGGAGAGGGGGAAAGGETRSRPLLRAAIARGFTRKQRVALTCVSTECKAFIQHLLEPNVELRMKIEEAARHRWVRRPGMRMKTHPLGTVEPKANREIYRQISELCGQTFMDVVAQIKADPFGAVAGIYNIKTHLHQMSSLAGAELLWSSNIQEARPLTPPEYLAKKEEPEASSSKTYAMAQPSKTFTPKRLPTPPKMPDPDMTTQVERLTANSTLHGSQLNTALTNPITRQKQNEPAKPKCPPMQSPRYSMARPTSGTYGLKSPVFKVYDNGDCGLDPRLPSIEEHSNPDLNDPKKCLRRNMRNPCVKKINLEERQIRLNSCPSRNGDAKRSEFYRRGGDGLPSWRASGPLNAPPARILLQSNATTIKRASLGNIVSPHSSTNSHCKSERAMPVGWYSTRTANKELPHIQRLRRTAPLK
ncbi:unnamed protein product [Diatraea saccharalis]|uniref:Protein kinase domain-containing protein n=1 Tax=Diatraea saccharalis TaxID=40085 RepID=A0A9N9RF00_9NEOP|nr:unnamed protein product [Diatraea saccharalis]